MSNFVDRLERDLVAAARRQSGGASRRRPSWRALAVIAALVVPTAASTAAGTLFALRGSVIPAPSDAPAEQTPQPATVHLVGFSVADPKPGAPRWTLRLARSRTGFVCSTVGQLVGGRFGIVGLDRKFRTLAPGVVDSCSEEQMHTTSLIGARVFDAPQRHEVRTVVSGLAGPDLRAVTIIAGGRAHRLAVHGGGTFLAAFAGYPEDLGIRADLRFTHSRVEVHAFGVGPSIVRDPAGGGAWTVSGAQTSSDSRMCVQFRPVRPGSTPSFSPSACGKLGGTRRRPTGLFFALRRLTPGTGAAHGGLFLPQGAWHDPPRTAVWGAYGQDVLSVRVAGPGVFTHAHTLGPVHTFLVMFGPHTAQVRVTVRMKDGRRLVYNRSIGLLAQSVSAPLPPDVVATQLAERSRARARARKIRAERKRHP